MFYIWLRKIRYRFFTTCKSKEIRFLLVGLLNTILGLSLFPALFFYFPVFSSNYLVLMAVSHAVCVSFSFFTQKFLVFESTGRTSFEIITFIFFHVVHLAAGMTLVEYTFKSYNISPGLVQPTYTLIVVVSSYFWYSKISFRKP